MSSARAAIRKEQYRMMKPQCLPMVENADAAIHRMLKSDALPSRLYSVVDSAGSLTSSADHLKNVMIDHFRKVFAKPAEPVPLPLSNPIPAMLFLGSQK
jgi:hypothetical protein